MPRNQRPVDPYAAPHAPKDRSGPVVRVAIIAVLLAGAALGWSQFASQPTEEAQTAPAAVQEQAALNQPVQVADSGATPTPEAIPAATPEAAAPAPQVRSTPAPRAARPAPAPAENVPPPTTTSEPTASPAPVQQM